jgi:predicted dehydrogenase
MKRGMLALGIVGCGWVTEHVHLPALRAVRGIRVHSACDTSAARLQHVRGRFGIERLHHAWQDLVSDPALDAVLVATPADQHAAIAHGALAAGKHVLVEKPLAVSLSEAEALAALARTSGRVAMVGLNFRFHPLVRRLRDAIVRGDLGRPAAAFFTLTSMAAQRDSVTGYELDPRRGGGVFHDKAVHVLDVLRFLFDCDVASGRATARSETHAHDFAALTFEMANGVLASGVCGDQLLPDFTCLVVGDGGKAMINLTRPTGLLLYRKAFARDRMARAAGYARQLVDVAGTLAYFATSRGRLSAYRAEWEAFVHGIATGTAPRPDFDDGVAVTRTVHELLTAGTTSTPSRR